MSRPDWGLMTTVQARSKLPLLDKLAEQPYAELEDEMTCLRAQMKE
ncbi:hypothetical protein [Hoyosella subflava]|uniref:Uncharacterized protein n=1 Tax=Hoyosella subflava (strain DSM 45089 / JCM 17490 / NBRC 109087 / DQS3-9A1) TaxID=443218 RepID=F6ER39_HOYSD|nr:hypothetical protein [Hoyosella subflava]AEF40726.1 hypothetical protein AS9A_2279 [Hoyosella subflava DQS3-9A1]